MNETEALIASYIDRAERLLEEIASLNADLKELGKDIKGDGLDYALIKRLATIRLKDKVKDEAEKLNTLGLYARAAGMQLDMFAGAPAHEPRSPAELVKAVATLAKTDIRAADAVVKVTQALAREPEPTPHDEDGVVIENRVSALKADIEQMPKIPVDEPVKTQTTDTIPTSRPMGPEADLDVPERASSLEDKSAQTVGVEPVPVSESLEMKSDAAIPVQSHIVPPVREMPDVPAYLDRRRAREIPEAADV